MTALQRLVGGCLLAGAVGAAPPVEAPKPAAASPAVVAKAARPVMPRTLPSRETTPAGATAPPAVPQRPLDPLDRQVDEAIAITGRRILVAETKTPGQGTHTPWQIGHGMLAYRRDYVVRVDGVKTNAYDWVSKNPKYNGRPWFYLTGNGARPQRYSGTPYEFEGHPNQFLAFFAMARLPLDFAFQVDGRVVTFGEMLRNAKMECTDREEITWILWAFAYYYDSDERWINAYGDAWSMERLVATQLREPVTKAPCGGCHALFALASARNAYLQTGNRLQGVWTETHMYLQQYIEQARQQQNVDGSFSSNYFKGPDERRQPVSNVGKRINTSGHTLEFLMMALPQDRLKEQWVRNGIAAVARDLIAVKSEALEYEYVGGMYHAAHALVLYRERTRPAEIARSPKAVRPVSADEDDLAAGEAADETPAAK